MTICKDTRYAIAKLAWMRAQGIWPNGRRYLWTDAFGLVLLVLLYAESGKRKYLDEAKSLLLKWFAYWDDRAASALVRRPIAMVNIFTTSPCGILGWAS